MPARTVHTLMQAWRVLLLLAGLAMLVIGTGMLTNGPTGLAGGVFVVSDFLPYWAWAAWALTGGVLILLAPSRIPGLLVAAAWFAIWGSVIMIGSVLTERAWYVFGIYPLLVSVYTLLAVTEHELGRGVRRRAAPTTPA